MKIRSPEELEQRRIEIHNKLTLQYKEKSRRTVSVNNAAQFWRTCCSENNCTTHLSFTQKERGMLRNLIDRLEDVNVYDFLEFCITHWSGIRKHFTEPGRKTSRIKNEQPSFIEIFWIKEDLLHYFTQQQKTTSGVSHVSQAQSITYKRVEDIPLNHPNRRILVKLIETDGSATVRS